MLNLAKLSFSGISFLVIDLNSIIDFLDLPYLDGIIGAEVFRRYIVDINYPKRIVRLYKSQSFEAKPGWTKIPFSFHNQLPMISGSLLDQKGHFIIDTGDRSELTLFKKFVDQSGLRSQLALSDTVSTGYGVGGPIYAQKARAHNFQMVGISIDSLEIRIPTLESGAFADANIAGSIGSGLLKSYRVIFNYRAQKIYITDSKR